MEKYIVISPVGNYMGYILEEFLTAVKNFDPSPEEIVLAIHLDHDFDLTHSMFDGVTIKFNPEIFVPNKTPPRIATGREILRLHFAHLPRGAKSIDYALSIDTDIICPPETPRVLYEVMEEKKVLIVSNKVKLRGSDRYAGGPACMLMHRVAGTIGKFFRGWYEDDEHGSYPSPEYTGKSEVKWANLSADLVFFSIIDQCSAYLKNQVGRGGRARGEFVEVEHKWKSLRELRR